MTSRAWSDTRDVTRSLTCPCGWGDQQPTLKLALEAQDAHVREGCEGCDHVISLVELPR